MFGKFLFGLDFFRKFLVEAIDAAVLGNEPLFAGVEGVAIRAGINLDFRKGGTGLEGASASGAGHGALVISGVNSFFHFQYLLSP